MVSMPSDGSSITFRFLISLARMFFFLLRCLPFLLLLSLQGIFTLSCSPPLLLLSREKQRPLFLSFEGVFGFLRQMFHAAGLFSSHPI